MRLIDADALGICKANRNVFDKPEYADGWNSAVAIIEDAPTVDAVEVVHGEWKLGESGVVYFCSQCRCAAHPRESERWHYCPYCGAKMDGERKVSEDEL